MSQMYLKISVYVYCVFCTMSKLFGLLSGGCSKP